jgi:peroxin-5
VEQTRVACLTRATLANANFAQKAMEAYFRALEINPVYIRARYNLAIACIQIGQYREAAEHLLGALDIQQSELERIKQATNAPDNNGFQALQEHQSNSVWSTLRILVDTYVKRQDLVAACDNRDLSKFKKEFDF